MMRWQLRAARALTVAGGLACVAMAVGINRTPLAWADEIAFAAAAYNLTLTGSSVPSHQVDIDTFLPPVKYYGPVYFRMAAAAIELFGLHPWSVRLVCLFGALLAGAGAYALARAAGAAPMWSMAAASLVILTPD